MVFFAIMLTVLFTATSVLSVAVKRDITEWQHVHNEMMRDITHLREQKGVLSDDLQHLREAKSAVSEDLQHLRETKSAVSDDLQRLRIQREDERQEWKREREANEQRRRGHVPFWGNARLLTAECPEDHIRQYDAPMHNLLVEDDWYAACMNTAIDIAGRGLASPRTCMNYGLDDGVRGYWSIEVNSSEC
ncbi:hypothetical protein BJV78DRAFT_1182816 [Lactifluus subvellereus]|nr:hypothetical protein BJV78DRAFT_1182816 [Lactifluus subvellereus]